MVRTDKKSSETPIQDVSSKQQTTKDMFRIGRRSGVSTSELGLYSDYSEYYNTNIYGSAVRKLVIGIMVVVTVILIGIFLYDFASSASISSKVNQETKHIYILQNSLKKSSNGTSRKSIVTLAPTIYIVNSSHASVIQDRIDDDRNLKYNDITVANPDVEIREQRMSVDEPELRVRNFQDNKIRDSALDRQHDKEDVSTEDKRTIRNHAMIYQVRSELSYSDKGNEKNNDEKNQQATLFRFAMDDPQPASFKHTKYPQLTQYRYPHTSRNIQDIIKYLTTDPGSLNQDIKFTGYYVGQKKYDIGHIGSGEIAMNNDLYQNQRNIPYTMTYNSDPFYQYKPKHPSDVNLLATSNFTFSPVEMYKHNPYYNPSYHRLSTNSYSNKNYQYDNDGLYRMKTYRKKQKPKPFSVVLDIYPITDTNEQPNKLSELNTHSINYETRRPIIPMFEKYSNIYGIDTQSLRPTSHQNQHQESEEGEKQQMILHLNLYPKQKMKTPRNNGIERSEILPTDENVQFIEKVIVPFNSITERLIDSTAIKNAQLYKNKELVELSNRRRAEILLKQPKSMKEMKEAEAERFIETTPINGCKNDCDISSTTVAMSTTSTKQTTNSKYGNSSTFKNTNNVESFQLFADNLIAMD